MTVALGILLLLAVLTVSGVLAGFTKLPLPILQIGVGAALALPTGGLHLALDPDLFLLVFIAPLLYADAFRAPKREFRALRAPIIGLAFGLVFLTVAVFGYGLHWLIPALPLPVAFALAAVLSPTDAVAVSSIIGSSRLPARLMHILEGEALLNDASGLVVFRFAVAATLTGQFLFSQAVPTFLLAVILGLAAGLAVSFCATYLLRFLAKLGGTSAEAQVVLTLLLPFAAYLLAEHFQASGILAAVTAGLTIARTDYFRHMAVTARLQNGALWTTLPFAFNGAIFLLLGVQLPTILGNMPPELSVHLPIVEPWLIVLSLAIALNMLRFAWVCVGIETRRFIGWLRGRPEPGETLRVKIVTAVAGVRGAVTLAGILSLPLQLPDGSPFPGRDLAIFLATGVILCSLCLACFLLPLIAHNLKMAEDDPIIEEERFARLVAAEAAIRRIEAFSVEAEVAGRFSAREVAERLTETYRRRAISHDTSQELHGQMRDVSSLEKEMLAEALAAERDAIRRLLLENRINDKTLQKLFSETVLVEVLVSRS